MQVIDCHAHLEERMLKVPEIPTMNDPLPETPKFLVSLFRWLMNSPCHPLADRLNRSFMTPEGHLKLKGKIYEIYPSPDNATVAAALVAGHPLRCFKIGRGSSM